MRNTAIKNALERTEGASFSNGVMVVGTSSSHVAIAFNDTPGQENQIVPLAKGDATQLMVLLASALGYRVDTEEEAAAVRRQQRDENYFDTLDGALNTAFARAAVDGAEFTEGSQEVAEFRAVFEAPGIIYGQTGRHSMPVLVRRGKHVLNLHLTVVIYRMDNGRYELTSYIN